MKHKALFCVILAMCLLFLVACFPYPREYYSMKEAGFYPTNEDFPSTKWVCQEMDMYFYMLEYGELVGEYTVDGTTYPFIGAFVYSRIVCTTYTYMSALPLNTGFLDIWTEETVNEFDADYIYQDGLIQCSSVDSEIVTLPTTLTFLPEGKIAQAVDTRWYAQEIDIYMDSFADTNYYFKGVWTQDGTEYAFEAFKHTSDGTYYFVFQNLPNNRNPCSMNNIMRLVYDQEQNVMIGILYASDGNFLNHDSPTITFTKVMPE